MSLSELLKNYVWSYPLEPTLKQNLVDRCFKIYSAHHYSTALHFRVRDELHQNLVKAYPEQSVEALRSTASDVTAIAYQRWETWSKSGKDELMDDLPESLRDLMAGALQRIESQKKFKIDQLCEVVRAYLFDGELGAGIAADKHARNSMVLQDTNPSTKKEKDELTRKTEGLLKEARTAICTAIQNGKRADLSIFPLDKDTEYLVRHYGEAARRIHEGDRAGLIKAMDIKKDKFKKWEGATLVMQMLQQGIPDYGNEVVGMAVQVSDDPWKGSL